MSAGQRLLEALKNQITLSGDVQRLTESNGALRRENEDLKEKLHQLDVRVARIEEWRSLLMAMAGARMVGNDQSKGNT